MTYREAIRDGLRDALQGDARTILLGEDVGKYGGAFACSKGLLEEFGSDRVRDTPLSESAFVGAAIGAAIGGMRPIVELMTVNFSLLALDQIVNNAATLRHMSGGQLSVPVVIRMTTGAGRRVAAQHSHSLEGWYAHIPGIKVAVPATVHDARFTLAAALREPDPVIIFEHIMLYSHSDDVDPSAAPVDLERAAIRRSGRDVTLIASGWNVQKALAAATQLANEKIEAEVVDLRVLRPLDKVTISESIARTHRAVIIDEGWKTGSFAAEVCASIIESSFFDLDAPVERVCSAEVPTPYAPQMEDAALPQTQSVVNTVKKMMGRHD